MPLMKALQRIWPALLLLTLSISPSLAAPVVIDRDTVWSGKVELDGIVAVNAEATLTLLPGTEVRFTAGAGEGVLFVIYGAVVAAGTAEAPILFTSGRPLPAAGDWRGLYLEETRERESLFRHCRIEFAEIALGGVRSKVRVENSTICQNRIAYQGRSGLQGVVSGCEILGNEIGFDLEKSDRTRIENCDISGNRQNGIQCHGISPEIRGNRIEENGGIGIFCRNEASPVIEGNLIRKNTIGIKAERQVSPEIRHNEIAENDTGLWLEKMAFPPIENNVIRGNRIGIYCNLSGYPRLQGNNIFANTELALDLGPKQSIEVTRHRPFREKRGESAMGISGAQSDRKNRQNQSVFLFPADGRIDARDNWWGEAGVAEMAAKGEDADLMFIEDAHDEPFSENRYPRDRFAYAPWAMSPVADAGLLAPAGPPAGPVPD